MNVNIYAIYDSKVAAYLQPWFAPTHASAFRNLEKALRNPQSPFADFPSDFTLFCLGTFDDISGFMHILQVPESLGTLLQFKSSIESSPAASDKAA